MGDTYRAAIAADIALTPSSVGTAAIDAPTDGVSYNLNDTIALAKQVSEEWVVEIPHVGDVLEKFADMQGVSVFWLNQVPGSLFATNASLATDRCQVIVADGLIGTKTFAVEATEKSDTNTITKVLKTAEERYVLGIVLAPETEDTQGDVYSAEEVRRAAHDFMENAQVLGKQHREVVDRDTLRILESYIAPADFQADGETVSKGTWLLGIRVVDDSLWGSIKKGEFTGFSIGGNAYRRPDTQS